MKILCLFLPLLIASSAGAQTLTTEEMLDQLADELLVTAEADVSYDELYETLTHLLANPADLNQVSREQLRAFIMLSESEINSLLTYREEQGPFLNVLELQAIPGWSEITVRRLTPFVFVRDPASRIDGGMVRRIWSETNSYLMLRYERTLEPKQGYSISEDSSRRYAGSPDKYYVRYRISRPGDFSVGFTAEKDPGEPMDWNPGVQYGFDFLSGHIQLMRKGRLENLVIGDFQAQFGQGLQLGSVFGLGKTAQTITGIRRSNLGFLPYMSASESYYLRGLAASFRLTDRFRLHVFGSFKNRDASVNLENDEVSSLQSSGLHRTLPELQGRAQVRDRDIGAVLQFKSRAVDAGILGFEKTLSRTKIPNPTPYNQFQFQGSAFRNIGAYVNVSWSNVTFFSEVAHTVGQGNAITAGLLGNFTSKLEMSWLYRSFDSNYFSEYANAVAESSVTQNEQGLYWGMKYGFTRKLSLSGYLDVFRFPWLRYRVYRPSMGSEWLLRMDYAPSKSMTFFLQAREETKDRNLSEDGPLYQVEPGTRRHVWLGGELVLSPVLSIQARVQGSQFELGGVVTRGMAFTQGVTWKQGRWSVSARYALFDTDDYDNRQYVYEKDVWMATSLPAYDGSGIRNYVLIHYALSRHLDCWVRWARTWYSDREVIGSGSEEIAGNARNDIKFQLRIRP